MCLTCGCGEPARNRRAVSKSDSGQLQPDEQVLEAVESALARAEGWIGWNGQATMSLGNAWTPHKALRRITDHLIDLSLRWNAASQERRRYRTLGEVEA
jgi:hypothetical protein